MSTAPRRADSVTVLPPGRERGPRIGVMHLTDTLSIGGAERVAVNYVNELPRDRFDLHLCMTRRDGPLLPLVRPDVQLLRLQRRITLDLLALRRLVRHIREHDVRILHAHGSAVFAAVAASIAVPAVAVVWHVHFGKLATEQQRGWRYRALAGRIRHAVTVSEPLAEWVKRHVGLSPSQVTYVPNFVLRPGDPAPSGRPALPGTPGSRIVCVANLLPEKDHGTLLAAMALLRGRVPDAHLVLLGGGTPGHERSIRRMVVELGLTESVTLMGQYDPVQAVLAGADVGVLASVAEGAPLALIEYGAAGLASVATNVGQCGAILGHGEYGLVVPPRDPSTLALAIEMLLRDPSRRRALGERFRERIEGAFSSTAVIPSVTRLYEELT